MLGACFSRRALLATLLATSLAGSALAQVSDPLPSWNESATKKSIKDFVARVTTQGSPDFVAPELPIATFNDEEIDQGFLRAGDDPGVAGFVAPELRIATFDNDGMLWREQPFYFQFAAFDP